MRVTNSKPLIAILGAVAFLLVASIVLAAPPPEQPSAPPQASPGLDADKVDGHDAAASWWSTAQRRWKVLWANGRGKLAWAAMPEGALNKRYLRRDDETLLAVNPFGIEGTSEIAANGGLNFMHHWLGYTQIWNTTHTQGTIFIPVDNFTTAFGSPLKLKGMDVCYQVASGSYIYKTGVYYADDTGGRTLVLWDDTTRASTTWTCYNVTNDPSAPIEGPLLVYFNLMFGGTGDTYKITIGQVTLHLEE
jgi:hypothetical protein